MARVRPAWAPQNPAQMDKFEPRLAGLSRSATILFRTSKL